MSQVLSRPTRQSTLSASYRLIENDIEEPCPCAARMAPVLIQLPNSRKMRQARRPSAMAAARIRANGGVPPRRRLRREIRLAGSVLLMVAPMLLATLLLSAGNPSTEIDATADLASVRPPAISLSIEAAGSETGSRVSLPGYLLPDDGAGTGSEEPDHAGG